MSQTQADQESLIDALVAGGVEFIVVGGIAAVLHGAPISTRDLDIVHARDAENVERLMAVLDLWTVSVRSMTVATSMPLLGTPLNSATIR